jgi:hypothetical protein
MGNTLTNECVNEGRQRSPDDELTPEEVAYNYGKRHQRMNQFDREDANFMFGGGRSGRKGSTDFATASTSTT